MLFNEAELQEVKFKERPLIVRSEATRECNDYDIIVDDPDNNEEYCQLLLEKLRSLITKDFQEAFINYQVNQLDDPKAWLQSLDKLMDLNSAFFFQIKREYLLHRFYGLITYQLGNLVERQDPPKTNVVQESKLVENPYDIEKTKKYLEGVWDLFEQRRILYRLRTDYLQSKHKFQEKVGPLFDKQIKLELSHLKLLLEYERQPILSQAKGNYIRKLTIIGNTIVFVMAFKALLLHKGDHGQPYLKIAQDEFIIFLSKVFQTEEGKPISKEILNRYLDSKTNKDSTINTEIQFMEEIHREMYYDYDIDRIKKIVAGLNDYVDRIIFLHRIRVNYLQSHIFDLADDFHRQIKLEIKQQKIEHQFEKERTVNTKKTNEKIKINGRVNVLMTFFYELFEEFPKKHNLQIFKNSKKDIIYFVQKYFIGKNGQELSLSSLRTMLTPSKWDKRCSFDKQVDLSECLRFGTE